MGESSCKTCDGVYDRVQEAAEKNGRACAIMYVSPSVLIDLVDKSAVLCRYNISGVPPDKIEGIIKFDWKQYVDEIALISVSC